jgi:hypothetical protein
VDAFYEGDEAFTTFLEAVRADLKRKYRTAFERLAELNWAQKKKAFRLITTHRPRPGAAFDDIPRENFIYGDAVVRLYQQFRKGETPKARPLQLAVQDKLSYKDPQRGVTSYLFNARLTDFRKYLEENDVARLVARNIRYNLGGRVGRDIVKTYDRRPHDFWYLHNGLTIVCDNYVESNQVATLMNPSVVNGAQTLYAISGSSRRDSPALVPARVVVRGDDEALPLEDDEWLQQVIRGVNTQNRVRAYDFRSNEPEQLELQNRFRDVKVFYERKRGEWRECRNDPRFRSFDRVSLRALGQLLTVVSDKTGKGVLLAKRSVEEIFDEKHYRKLFPSRAKVARRFEKIYLAYRVYELLSRYGYRDSREYRKQRHGFWHTLLILHRGITSIPQLHSRATVDSIRAAFDRFEARGAVGRSARKAIKEARQAVWASWKKWRRADTERWTPNNFFKAKWGTGKVLGHALSKVQSTLRGLGRHIVEH